jgi:AcrR family transcriptional regulator
MASFMQALFMKNTKNLSTWLDTGYELFAREGLEGIQIERLARIVGLNKSGFYHYFGNLEIYRHELVKSHVQKVQQYFDSHPECRII